MTALVPDVPNLMAQIGELTGWSERYPKERDLIPPEWECPYCTTRHHAPIDPSMILCCGELGHCTEVCPKCDSGICDCKVGVAYG